MVRRKATNIRFAWYAFRICSTYSLYQDEFSAEHSEITDWLPRVTTSQLNYGVGGCCQYVRKINNPRWYRKRISRVRASAKAVVFDCIEGLHNRIRRHSH